MLLLSGVAALLLLVLMLVVAERKARTANEHRARHTARQGPEKLTPEELTTWRAEGERLRSDEVEVMKRAVETWATEHKARSGEWKRAHEPPKK